jgi:hypothetical protein
VRESQAFEPIAPNPYIVGNPVREATMFFGREAEFQLVINRFRDSRHGGLIVFFGERRSGKTSILFQIMDGRLGPDFLPVLIDMQSMAIENEQQFYAKIVTEIVEVLKREGVELNVPAADPARRPSLQFLEFIDSLVVELPGKRPILLIDEYELLEKKIDAGILTEDVLDILAALLQKHPFYMIFTGSDALEGRKRKYWRILGQSIAKRISFLDPQDAIQLITKPVEGRLRYADGMIERLVRLGAGQPFYTQALCQTIVDHLNDHHTNVVTDEVVTSVVHAIAANPFPQMIFLWESLSMAEKMTLSLLAELLPDETQHAHAEELRNFARERRYPVSLSQSRIESTLDELFQKDLLQKHREAPPNYSYRMDLWRIWILRAHTVWQVVRENVALTRTRRTLLRTLRWGAAVPILAVAFLGIRGRMESGDRGKPEASLSSEGAAPALAAAGILTVVPTPESAVVVVDGDTLGTGRHQMRARPGRAYRVTLAAPGYEDSTFFVTVEANDPAWRDVALRPRRGSLRVTSEPAGAKVLLAGIARGVTPCVVDGLDVNEAHELRIEAAGHAPFSLSQRASPDSTTHVHGLLTPLVAAVVVTTEPAGAKIRFDEQRTGLTPLSLSDVEFGRHRIVVEAEGRVGLDTTVTVASASPTFHFELPKEPPGILVVQGLRLARAIWVDHVQIVANVYNSGPCTLSTGQHRVEVELPDSTITATVRVEPNRKVVYDYVQGKITSRE